MSYIEEIMESFDPLREHDETLEQYASRMDKEKPQKFLKEYKNLSTLGNLEVGNLHSPHDEGDHVKATHRENGFELSLLMLLYKMERNLDSIHFQLKRLADAAEAE